MLRRPPVVHLWPGIQVEGGAAFARALTFELTARNRAAEESKPLASARFLYPGGAPDEEGVGL